MSVKSATCEAPFADALVELATRREEVVVLSADLSRYTDLLPFISRFPERFIQVGMAEQNMMGIAGGMAKRGYLPIAVTYGVFASRRAYDQIAMALCTGPSRGIVVAFLPGITTPFRATHQAIDDLAIMRALPGMTVIDPADALEVAAALNLSADAPGSVYMRSLRGRVAQLFEPESFDFVAGRPRTVLGGGHVGLISTGIATEWAMQAADLLAHRGTQASILHVPVVKPLDAQAVLDYCVGFSSVTCIENHSVLGGLGTAVRECVAAAGVGVRVRALGIPDRWAPAGSVEYIRAALGLDAASVARFVEVA
jgi:transketolase